MKALFIGGTGIISSAVSKLAAENGIELHLLNRGSNTDLVPKGAKVIKADIRDAKAAAAALKGQSFDVVVDWIAFVPQHVETDISLFSGKCGQYIFISSASAYQKPPAHYLVTESTPLANPNWQYSRDKIACEERLTAEYRKNGFPITIVRPSLTYGNTMIPAAINSWNHPWTIVDRMRKGKKVITPGDGTSLWTCTHNTDFARGFVGLMGNVQTLGHAFHITSDEVLTWDQIYKAIGAAAGAKPIIVHVTSDLIAHFNEDEGTGSMLGDKAHSVVFDNTKLKTFVPGYVATMPFAQGVRQTIEYFEAHPKMCSVDADYEKFIDDVVAAQEKVYS